MLRQSSDRLFQLSSTVMSSVAAGVPAGIGGGGGGAPPPPAGGSQPAGGGGGAQGGPPSSSVTSPSSPALSGAPARKTALEIAEELDRAAASQPAAPAPPAPVAPQAPAPAAPVAPAAAHPGALPQAALPPPVRPAPPQVDPNIQELSRSMAALQQLIADEKAAARAQVQTAEQAAAAKAARDARIAAREASKPRPPHPNAPIEDYLRYAEASAQWAANNAAEDATERALSQAEEKYGAPLSRVEKLQQQLEAMRQEQVARETDARIQQGLDGVMANPQYAWMLDNTRPIAPNVPGITNETLFHAIWYGLNERFQNELADKGGAFHPGLIAGLLDRMVASRAGGAAQNVSARAAAVQTDRAAASRQQAAGAPVHTVNPGSTGIAAPGQNGPFRGRTRDELPPGLLPSVGR